MLSTYKLASGKRVGKASGFALPLRVAAVAVAGVFSTVAFLSTSASVALSERNRISVNASLPRTVALANVADSDSAAGVALSDEFSLLTPRGAQAYLEAEAELPEPAHSPDPGESPAPSESQEPAGSTEQEESTEPEGSSSPSPSQDPSPSQEPSESPAPAGLPESAASPEQEELPEPEESPSQSPSPEPSPSPSPSTEPSPSPEPSESPAPAPLITISNHPPHSVSVTEGRVNATLFIGATESTNAGMMFQWYRSLYNGTNGGVAIPGANGSAFVIPRDITAAEGTYFYYCVVSSASGAAPVTSGVSIVTVYKDGQEPEPGDDDGNQEPQEKSINITAQPASAITVHEGNIAGQLSLTAVVRTSGGGSVSQAIRYQWRTNTTASNVGGSDIADATSRTFSIPADLPASSVPYYYYCVVSTDGAESVPTRVSAVTVSSESLFSISITAQPDDAVTVYEGNITGQLSLTASVRTSANASVSQAVRYQWRSNTVASNEGGTDVAGATSRTFSIPTSLSASSVPYYYYCVVSTDGADSVSTRLTAVTVTSDMPFAINVQPESHVTVTQGSVSGSVYVEVEQLVSGAVKYQWERSSSSSTTGFTAISGATSSTYSFPSSLYSSQSPEYFRCVITHTYDDGSVYKAISEVTTVTINSSSSTPYITLTSQPAQATTVTEGAITGSLNVTASVSNGATRSYQWYRNTTASTSGGTAISGATSSSLTIPRDLTSTGGANGGKDYYFFCEVRATNATSQRTRLCTVTVNPPTGTGSYTLTLVAGTGGRLTTGKSGTYKQGQSVSLVAAVNTGYRFVNWTSSNGGTFASSTSANTTFTMPGAATTVTAVFSNSASPAPTAGSGGSSGSSAAGSGTGGAEADAASGKGVHGTYVDPAKQIAEIGQANDAGETVPGGSASFINVFADISPDDWFAANVAYVFNNQLMNGTQTEPELLFSPDLSTTRAMIVTVLYRAAGEPDTSAYENPYSDVPEGSYYFDPIKWAAANDLVAGYGDGLFGPEDYITREQLASILYRYEQYSGKVPAAVNELKEFADWDDVSGYATESIEALVGQGIINGKPHDLFDPHGQATRAEVAAMLNRMVVAMG